MVYIFVRKHRIGAGLQNGPLGILDVLYLAVPNSFNEDGDSIENSGFLLWLL